MIIKTQGIIIKKRDLTGADRLLTVYTKDFGKIILKARGVKKNQAKLKGHLELFVWANLLVAKSKNIDIITNAETLDNFSYLKKNISHLILAYYFSELIDKLIVAPEPDPNIWNLFLSSFCYLNKNKNSRETEKILSFFEVKFLEYLGYDLTSQKRKPIDFITYTLGEKINSKKYLNVLK